MALEETLTRFLVAAKRHTYASGGEGEELKLDDGGKELTYREGKLRYRDRYYGFNPFAGQEAVFDGSRCVWAMNYFGRVIREVHSVPKTYVFLKKALMEVEEGYPFRGPERFTDGVFDYENVCSGDIGRFTGHETIEHDRAEVYRLSYHGGFVKGK